MDESRWTLTDAAPGENWARIQAQAATLERLALSLDDVFLQSLRLDLDAAGLGLIDGLLQFTAAQVASRVGGDVELALRLASAARAAMRDTWAKSRTT